MTQQNIGIGATANDGTGDTLRDAFDKTNENFTELYASRLENRVVVKQPSDLSGVLDSTKEYLLDGIIDFTGSGLNISVPAGGLNLAGYSFDVSKIVCADASYTLFTSPAGGSGNLLGKDYAIEVTGTGSQVYDLVSATGFDAFEFNRINYNNCSSLGVIDNYRQGFEAGTGRFGGSPSLTLAGVWLGGYFIDASIVRSLDSGMSGALFQAGSGFQMNSRFRSNMNTDLPASAAYSDFAPSQFPNPSTVQMEGAIITRNGVADATDTNIFPNMVAGDLAAQWRENVGLDNTYVGGRVEVAAEIATTVAAASTYYDLNGTYTASDLEHFDNPAGGQLRHLGNNPRDYTATVDLILDGTSGDNLELKLVKWDDSASSFVDIDSQRRVVNNLLGGRDVAFFNAVFLFQLDKNDYVKLQVQNTSGANNVTAELDSFMLVSER